MIPAKSTSVSCLFDSNSYSIRNEEKRQNHQAISSPSSSTTIPIESIEKKIYLRSRSNDQDDFNNEPEPIVFIPIMNGSSKVSLISSSSSSSASTASSPTTSNSCAICSKSKFYPNNSIKLFEAFSLHHKCSDLDSNEFTNDPNRYHSHHQKDICFEEIDRIILLKSSKSSPLPEYLPKSLLSIWAKNAKSVFPFSRSV